MVRIRAGLALLCALLSTPPLPVAADGSRSGRIETARERMSENASSSDDDDDGGGGGVSSLLDDDDDDDCEDCESGVVDRVLGRALFYMLIFPIWSPAIAVGDWTPLRHYGFRAYPYEAGAEGPLHFPAMDEQGRVTEPHPLELSLRTLASYERHAANLDGRRLRLTLRSNTRFGLDASITRYTEAPGAGQYDALWHYAALGTYAFAVSPRTQFTAGLGARGFRFSAGDHFTHLAFHYAAELFPVRPVHLWLLGEASLGASGSSSELEAGLGVIVHRFEVFGGYRRFRVVGVDFTGPELGVIAWF